MLLLGGLSFAQDFEVQIDISPVTCSSEGAFTFSATDSEGDPIPEANMEYYIYDLPDENLVAILTGESSYSALAVGEYKVVAIHDGDFVNAITYEPLEVEDACFFNLMTTATHICGTDIYGSFTFFATYPDGNLVPVTSMSYEIYKLPEETLVATLVGGTNSYSSLEAGEYKVVAVLDGDVATTTVFEPLEIKELCFDVYTNVTPAECPDSGVFTFFTVDHLGNPIADTNMEYHIYKLPGETLVASLVGGINTYTTLAAGEYKVVAIKNGDAANPMVYEPIVVEDQYTLIDINATYTVKCGNDTEITVNLIDGSATEGIMYHLYEVNLLGDPIPGGFTAPPQSSNIFDNLPAFTPGVAGVKRYTVVATDSCGQSDAFTVNVQYNPLAPVDFLDQAIGLDGSDCTDGGSVIIQNALSVPVAAYPITITYTIYPPASSGDETLVYTHTIDAGPPQIVVTPSGPVPYYPGEIYYYSIQVTNSCGDLWDFALENQPVVLDLNAWWGFTPDQCYGFDIFIEKFVAGVTLNFIDYPDGFDPYPPGGFDPYEMNENHPDFTLDPFTFTTIDPMTGVVRVTYAAAPLKSPDEDVPNSYIAGDYYVQVVNECEGQIISTFDLFFSIPEQIPPPQMQTNALPPSLPDCDAMGSIIIAHQINLVENLGDLGHVFMTFLGPDGPPPTDWWEDIEEEDWEDISLSVQDISSPLVPNNFTMLQHAFVVQPGEYGWYGVHVIDACGNEFYVAEKLDPYVDPTNAYFVRQSPNSCTEGGGSVDFVSMLYEHEGGQIGQAWLLQAPQEFKDLWGFTDADFPINLMEDLDENPDGLNFVTVLPIPNPGGDPNPLMQWHLVMTNLPPGDYQFELWTVCTPGVYDVTILDNDIRKTEFELFPQCGSFCFWFDHYNDPAPPPDIVLYWEFLDTFSLERYNTVTGEWDTVIPFPEPYQTPSLLVVDEENCSPLFDKQGYYRIVKRYYIYQDANAGLPVECYEVIYEFEYFVEPKINGLENIACTDGGSDIIIDAVGVGTLVYEILQGDTVLYGPQESNVFSGINLPPGVYTVRVEGCGIKRTASFTVTPPVVMEVVGNNLCEGQVGSLSVQDFTFLTYEWYHIVDGEEVFVGLGHELIFDPFTAAQHGGDYIVKVTYVDNPDSCANQEIPFTIPVELPNAGIGQDGIYCHQNQNIDLFTLLSDYDEGGTWQEVDTTGALQGSNFVTQDVPVGTYTFKYVIETECAGDAEATVTVTLEELPSTPQVVAFDPECAGGSLTLLVENPIAQYTYTWTLPNGNTYVGDTVPLTDLTEQDGGTYSVIASLGDCVSEPTSVNVVVKPLPDFNIAGNTVICLGQYTTLSVAGVNFQNSEATFAWQFPDGTTSTDASVNVNQIGDYSVTVTFNGCEDTRMVTVTEKTDLPVAQLDKGCINDQFTLWVVNAGEFANATFEWTGPGGFAELGSMIAVTEVGLYQLTITDTDGCVVLAEIDVPSTYCFIPKGISPNDDTLNDSFDLSNLNVSELQIFNRYGRTVYEAKNGYTNQWHGQTNDNKMLPSATYYYVVTFVDGSKKTGWVYLNRGE